MTTGSAGGTRRITAVAIGAVATLVTTQMARAVWADTAPISTANVTTGDVAITAGGSVETVLAPVTITPSFAGPVTQHVPLVVANSGNVATSYRLDGVTADVATNPLFTTGMTVRIAAVANAAACTGVNPGTTILAAGSAPPTAAFGLRPPLQPVGAGTDRETLCLSLTVPLPTNPSFRTGAVTLTLRFTGQSL